LIVDVVEAPLSIVGGGEYFESGGGWVCPECHIGCWMIFRVVIAIIVIVVVVVVVVIIP